MFYMTKSNCINSPSNVDNKFEQYFELCFMTLWTLQTVWHTFRIILSILQK